MISSFLQLADRGRPRLSWWPDFCAATAGNFNLAFASQRRGQLPPPSGSFSAGQAAHTRDRVPYRECEVCMLRFERDHRTTCGARGASWRNFCWARATTSAGATRIERDGGIFPPPLVSSRRDAMSPQVSRSRSLNCPPEGYLSRGLRRTHSRISRETNPLFPDLRRNNGRRAMLLQSMRQARNPDSRRREESPRPGSWNQLAISGRLHLHVGGLQQKCSRFFTGSPRSRPPREDIRASVLAPQLQKKARQRAGPLASVIQYVLS
ncbi:uncharacterized protein B0H18DRAFT_375809 [Fomitopsis serialis]|uniref:uncharacterized protein n=1 Tax=Fomitopsis serialis TaxID=139415 RepID=UPI002008BD69|nr:uncharacterized protein B0H18DRAFT_375809 [Neoantrodia serialis]KAH9925532.1 hypothetical protein B0H18DRAFT_375809 [Neoantrodia serialis]